MVRREGEEILCFFLVCSFFLVDFLGFGAGVVG